MTLAKTGNRIADQLARASAANQKKEAAAKSRAAKAAKSGGRMSKVRGGRAAIKAGGGRGRGVVGKVHTKAGGGAAGLVNYAMGKQDAVLIASNCGSNSEQIIKDMNRCGSLRSVKSPVGHVTFSLPTSTKIDAKKWEEIIEFARSELELDDSYSFAAVRHNDTDHDHIHLVYSRVSDRGEIHQDYRLGLRLALIEDQIEDRFGLPLIPVDRSGNLPAMKKNEIEKAIRTGMQPDRVQLNSVVMKAAEGNPTAVEFIARCAASGVVVKPNLSSSTGKLSGFSFSLVDGIGFKGSQIGASWAELQKKGVSYEQIRDGQALADLAAKLAEGQRTDNSDQSAPASAGDMGEAVEKTDRSTKAAAQPADHADRTVEKTDRPVEGQIEEVRTASTDPVLHRVDPVDRPGVARPQTIAADQIEPAPIEREAFEQIKRDLLATNASAEARAAAAVSMNWSQQAEVRQIIKNIDAWHKRMNQVSAVPTAGDRPTSLPSM